MAFSATIQAFALSSRTTGFSSVSSLRIPSSLDAHSSSTSFISLVDASSVSSTDGTFEAVVPPTEMLVGFGVILLLSIVSSWVWANQVVPVSRQKLAISKSRGQVKEYLQDLKQEQQSVNATDASVTTTEDDRGFERWLFSDWLQDNKSEKQPAIPILKKAKWNSGDNPVLAATALITLGVIITSVTERAVSLF